MHILVSLMAPFVTFCYPVGDPETKKISTLVSYFVDNVDAASAACSKSLDDVAVSIPGCPVQWGPAILQEKKNKSFQCMFLESFRAHNSIMC